MFLRLVMEVVPDPRTANHLLDQNSSSSAETDPHMPVIRMRRIDDAELATGGHVCYSMTGRSDSSPCSWMYPCIVPLLPASIVLFAMRSHHRRVTLAVSSAIRPSHGDHGGQLQRQGELHVCWLCKRADLL